MPNTDFDDIMLRIQPILEQILSIKFVTLNLVLEREQAIEVLRFIEKLSAKSKQK